MNKRYVLMQDGDCHWYVVNVNYITAAEKYFALEDDGGELPTWLHRVGGSPMLVTFSDPQIGTEWIQ